MRGRRQQQEEQRSGEEANPPADATIQEMIGWLVGDSDLKTTTWSAFAVLMWLGEPFPMMQVFRYDSTGRPFFVDFDHDQLAEFAQRLQITTRGPEGQQWRAATMTYVETTGKLGGDFHYGDDADPWLPNPVDGARSEELALRLRPA